MTTVTVIDDGLVRELNREYWLFEQAAGEAGAAAWRAGRILLDVKAQLGHGELGPWIDQNFEGSRSLAEKYMRVAREFADPQLVTDLGGLKLALKEASTPRPTRASASDASVMLQGLAGGGQIAGQPERPRAVSPLNLAWSSQQERKRAKARDLLNDAHAKVDDASTTGLSAFSRAATLREAAIKARQAASELDALAFSFES